MMADRHVTPIQRFFSGLAEYAFESRLGIADPPLVEYMAALLTRFVHCDALFAIRTLTGRRVDEVVDMLAEAQCRVGTARRDIHRHIGDFTLFWTGVYPEALCGCAAPTVRIIWSTTVCKESVPTASPAPFPRQTTTPRTKCSSDSATSSTSASAAWAKCVASGSDAIRARLPGCCGSIEPAVRRPLPPAEPIAHAHCSPPQHRRATTSS